MDDNTQRLGKMVDAAFAEHGHLNNGQVKDRLGEVFRIRRDEIDCYAIVVVRCDNGNHSRLIASDLEPEELDTLLAEVVNYNELFEE